MNWINTTVGEYCPFIYGKALPKRIRKKGSIPVYGSNGIVDYHSESCVSTPGVVIGRKGTIGSVHLSTTEFWPIDTSFYLQKDNFDELIFTYYLLTTLGLENKNTDTAIPGLNREVAHSISIRIPELSKDRANLGRWLYLLDKKIKINNQINETLEAMAQAIFKSWFVDFDPVRAKAEAKAAGKDDTGILRAAMAVISSKSEQALAQMAQDSPDEYKKLEATAKAFPEAFVESELGLIPEGWEVKKAEDISDKIAMGPFGSNLKVSTFVNHGVPIISGHHLHNSYMLDEKFNYITEEHAEKIKNSSVISEDIIFTHAGTIGQVSMIPSKSKFKRYIISQRQFYFRANKELVSPYYILYYFRSVKGQHQLLSCASQVGVPSISRPVSNLKSMNLLLPNLLLLKSFDVIVKNNSLLIFKKIEEINTLIELRDSLLPKLLSGEIEV